MGLIFRHGFDIPDEDSEKTNFVAKLDTVLNIAVNSQQLQHIVHKKQLSPLFYTAVTGKNEVAIGPKFDPST